MARTAAARACGAFRVLPALCAVATSLALIALSPADAQAQARTARTAPAICVLNAFATGTVKSVSDGRSFVLDDGREIRLSAIEVPGEDAAGAAARAALATLVDGKAVTLKHALAGDAAAPAKDRYGRVLAFVFVSDGTAASSVQQSLLRQGHARVAARVDERDCAADLYAAESTARRTALGVWSDPHYLWREAEKPAEVLAERGRFTVVRGRVLSVRESGGTIYVNFGRRWSEDFTVTIAKRSERAFAAAGVEPKSLAGHRVEVRGWIEERGGPWIDAVRPEQIRMVDGE